MRQSFCLAGGRARRLAVLVVATATLAFGQMGGGMGGMGGGPMGPGGPGAAATPGTPGQGPAGNTGYGMGSGIGSGMGFGMGGGAGMGRMEELTIGSDGTAYVIRAIVPATATAPRHELLAIQVRDGAPRWKLEIPGTMVAGPALGKDGKIFLTAGEPWSEESRKAKLLVVTADLLSARIINTVEVDVDALSAPQTAPDETGNYVVYVTGFEMGGMGFGHGDDGDAVPGGERYLYAFWPDGRLKFKLKLSEARPGLAPR